MTPAIVLRAAGALLLHLVAPRGCAGCDAPLVSASVFCGACAATVVRVPAGRVVAFGEFGGALADALRRMKYGARPDLAAPLGELARRAALSAGLRADVVVPVPLHPARLAERGFNQAALLAARVAGDLGGALLPRALARTRDTPRQASLDGAARRENVRGAFRARQPARLAGQRVVLVDDVATTGATLCACEEALAAAGAASVRALVVGSAEGRQATVATIPGGSTSRGARRPADTS